MTKNQMWVLILGVFAVLISTAVFLILTIREPLRSITDLSDTAATRFAQITKPTPTFRPDPVTIIHAVQSLARLETIQYSVEKVITAESGQGTWGFLFGDRLLLVAHGTVIAGIDLGKLQSKDVRVDGEGSVSIILPTAEVFTATLDNDKTYIYDREVGPLAPSQSSLETQARQEAQRAILDAALQDGILVTAYQNAELYLERFLLSLGFQRIVFQEATPVPVQQIN